MRTIYKWLIALATIGLLGAALFHSCSPTEKELLRVPSPDGVVDAVLVVRLTGTLANMPYFVYIVPSKSTKMGYAVLLGDDFVGLKLRWSAPRFLEVEFSKGRIVKFKNFWEDRSVQNFKYIVEIRLKPTSDRSLPPWDQ